MRRKLFVLLVTILLTACSAVPSTTAIVPTLEPTSTGTPAVTLTPTSAPTETLVLPSLPPLASPQLTAIDFQDSQRGWGLAANGTGAIVRTLDGGRTWLNATPAGLAESGRGVSLTVLDSEHVWVLIPGPDFYSAMLYHTGDGGESWASNAVPFGSADLQFVDELTGRALADRGAGAGSNAVGLYQTADGGVTWTSVFHNDPTEPGSSNTLPLGGIKNGMTFLTPNDGWVSGSVPVQGNVYLYATHDGGVSWAQVDVPLPAGEADAMTMAHPPIFFGQEGLFPLTLTDSTSLLFYLSHDGGATWSASGQQSILQGRYSFADPTEGWVWDGTNPPAMTIDGGKTWQTLSTSLSLPGTLNTLQFVPAGEGRFTGWALSDLDQNNHSTLYQTTDNGLTWTSLTP